MIKNGVIGDLDWNVYKILRMASWNNYVTCDWKCKGNYGDVWSLQEYKLVLNMVVYFDDIGGLELELAQSLKLEILE